ncbi:MAG: nitroreductase family protein [Halanaerobiales bacterium]|nr:nitroreductase family protein [Halanaerobiales bacterium]
MDIMEAIRTRRSIRDYKDEPINDEILQKLLTAGQLAPTGNNKQMWKLVVVKDAEMRKKVNEACAQDFIGDAPVVIVACSSKEPKDMNATIVVDHISLVAASEGLGTCWIRSFDEAKVKELLAIPADVNVVCLLPVGYPVENLAMPEHKPLTELVSYDRY